MHLNALTTTAVLLNILRFPAKHLCLTTKLYLSISEDKLGMSECSHKADHKKEAEVLLAEVEWPFNNEPRGLFSDYL